MPENRHSRRKSGAPVTKISVVTVCLNTRDSIRLTLDSIARQSFPNVEHVVIDGGSKDGTQDIVREYNVGYFVSEKDKGIYDAMDKGARAATGDILIFLNAGDTFYDDDTAADVVHFFNTTDADIVFGNLMPVYLRPSDKHDHSAFQAGQLLDLGYVRNRRQLYNESIHHQATFYRRWIFDRCSYACPSPEASGEYNLLLNAVMKQHASVKHIPRAVARFVLGGTSTRDFTVEWPKYVKARDTLRSLYIPNPDKLKIKDKNEFSVAPAPTSPADRKLQRKIWLKERIKRTLAFRIYDRLGFGMSARVANALLPTVQQLQLQIRQEVLEMYRQEFHKLQKVTKDVSELSSALSGLNAGQRVMDDRLQQLNAVARTLQVEGQEARRTGIQIQLDLAAIHESVHRPADFMQSGFKVFSQWNEDGLIQHLISNGAIESHTFVEIGTGDYSEANTRLLLQKNHWSGLIIDSSPDFMHLVRESELYWRYPLKAVSAFVDAENVNELLTSNGMSGEIGLLSIDIDGVDYWVWQAITAISPQVVICEYNGLFGSAAKVTVPYDPRFDRTSKHYSWLYAGASLGALQHLAAQKGYTLVGTNNGGNNAFFVRNDVLKRSNVRAALQPYTYPIFRESRNPDGTLSYLDVKDGVQLVRDLQVWDVEHDQMVKIADIPLSYH